MRYVIATKGRAGLGQTFGNCHSLLTAIKALEKVRSLNARNKLSEFAIFDRQEQVFLDY